MLDEVARREHLDVTDDEVERESARYAERTGRTPAAVRAALEKERRAVARSSRPAPGKGD